MDDDANEDSKNFLALSAIAPADFQKTFQAAAKNPAKQPDPNSDFADNAGKTPAFRVGGKAVTTENYGVGIKPVAPPTAKPAAPPATGAYANKVAALKWGRNEIAPPDPRIIAKPQPVAPPQGPPLIASAPAAVGAAANKTAAMRFSSPNVVAPQPVELPPSLTPEAAIRPVRFPVYPQGPGSGRAFFVKA